METLGLLEFAIITIVLCIATVIGIAIGLGIIYGIWNLGQWVIDLICYEIPYRLDKKKGKK